MYLEIGQKVRITPTERGRKGEDGKVLRKEKYGRICKIADKVIAIKTSNYNMSFNISDIIAPNDYYLNIWNGSKWRKLESVKISSFKEIELSS